MKVTQRCIYALKALIHLTEAQEKGLVKVHEIAQKESLPEKFLESILITLKNARMITSQRGREGGYRLRRNPEEILLGEVVRLIDGPLAPMSDAAELADRILTEPRHPGLFAVLLDVRNSAAAILDHTSLASVVEKNRGLLAERHAPTRGEEPK